MERQIPAPTAPRSRNHSRDETDSSEDVSGILSSDGPHSELKQVHSPNQAPDATYEPGMQQRQDYSSLSPSVY
jgi:hypothetical protein